MGLKGDRKESSDNNNETIQSHHESPASKKPKIDYNKHMADQRKKGGKPSFTRGHKAHPGSVILGSTQATPRGKIRKAETVFNTLPEQTT